MTDTLERRISGLTVVVERDGCIGTGACTKVAPEVFELDDQQLVAFRESPEEIDPSRLVEACEICPVDALRAVP